MVETCNPPGFKIWSIAVIPSWLKHAILPGFKIWSIAVIPKGVRASASKAEIEEENKNGPGAIGGILALILVVFLLRKLYKWAEGSIVRWRGGPPDPFYSFEGPPCCDDGLKRSITDPAKKEQ